jgi:hypothetical protein
MKRYNELTEDQQAMAIDATLRTLVRGLMNGTVEIKLKHEMHQRVMTNILSNARENGDFSRFSKFASRSKKFKEEIAEMAEFSAKNAYYTSPREFVLYDIAD